MEPRLSLAVSCAAGAIEGLCVLGALCGSGWAAAGALITPSVLLLVAHVRRW